MADTNDRGRLRRISAAALTVMGAVAVFAALGGIGLASGVISAAQYQYGGGKVTICHKGKTITVSQKAWPAHQRHGDTQGACTTSSKKKDHGKHKGSSHHAPNPGSGGTTTTTSTAPTTTTSTTTTSTTESHGNGHGNGGDGGNGNGHGNGNGNGGGKGNGHNK